MTIRRLLPAVVLAAGATLVLGARDALAQQSLLGATPRVGEGGALRPTTETSGVKLSDSAILHAGVGADVGFDTNVFYNKAETGSVLVRVVPFLELTNATRDGAKPSGAYYLLGATLTYREYPNADENVRAQRAFMPQVNGSLELNNNQSLMLALSDTFTRTEDPPYQPGDPSIERDSNQGKIEVRVTPGGGRFSFQLAYANTLNYFEDDLYRDGSHMEHTAAFDASWRWLPKTALYLRYSQGMVQYFDDRGVVAYPLRAMGGLRGLLTEKLQLDFAAGYMNGFYEGAANQGAAGQIAGGAQASYYPIQGSEIVLGYRHDFQNTIIAQFYYLDTVFLVLRQTIARRFNAAASAAWEHRNFQGLSATVMNAPTTRIDDFFSVGAQLDYSLRQWFTAGVGYSMLLNASDFAFTDPMSMQTFDLDYVKHQVFARIGIAY